MPISGIDKLLHWNYFLAVEEDLYRLSRYIEFTEDNFYTYSVELTQILFRAAAEVDVIAKQFCDALEPRCDARNIDQYKKTIVRSAPALIRTQVLIPRFSLTLGPWVNWSGEANPDWWRAHNAVKHSRDKHYKDSNLKNALNAVGGLFLMLLFFYREDAIEGRLRPNPIMLRLGSADTLFWDNEGTFTYPIDLIR